jgi:dihydrofolate reductase
MRRIVTFNRVTADGYFAGPDGKLDWVVPDEELDALVSKRIDAQGESGGSLPAPDTVLFGRKTYDMFASFWPHVLDDPEKAPDPHNPARRSPAMRAMATWLNEATKVVFSKTLKDATWKNTRVLRQLEPREIEDMKRGAGKDMIVFGSGSVASQLAQHGLVDEYQFVVCPVVLGGGRTLLGGVPKASKVNLLEARPFPSGNVMLRYVRAAA